jgi:hypothetical protein
MDCLEGMKLLDDNSIDAIVTDPPYSLGFMGKDWDTFKPQGAFENKKGFKQPHRNNMKELSGFQQFTEQWAKEALRVLKPGGHLLSFGGTRTFHRMACAIEDAGFQIRDTIMWVYGCLDEQTEILTEDGWKKYNEISITNKVFSFVNKKIIKNSVKNIFNYQVKNEEMIYIKNHNTNQLLTKNHKMLIQENNRKQINNIRDSWYDENFRYVDAWDRPQKYKIPLSGIYDGKYSIGKDFAEVIGWIISEGHFQKDCNAVNIYQSSVNKEKVERIKYVLGRCGIIYSEYKREREYKDRKYVEHQFYISGEWSKKIKDIIPNKKINKKLLELSHGEKERLIVGLCEGDGSKNRNGGYGAFYQSDLEQLELFQILLHLTNKQGWINKNKMCCSIHYNPTTEIQGKHKKQSKIYTGIVWCIETEIGNFMARRNGKIFITGNSGFPKSLNIGFAVNKLETSEWLKISKAIDNFIDTNNLSNICKENLNNVKIVETQSLRNQTETGICMQKSDSVQQNVVENINQRNLNLIVNFVEKNLNEAQVTDTKINIVLQNVEAEIKQSLNLVKSVEQLSQNQNLNQSMDIFTAECDVKEWLKENIMVNHKVDEALKTLRGNKKYSNEEIINVLCAILTDILKHTTLNQSKTFQNLDTNQQMECVYAINVTITKSIMENLILNTVNILKSKAVDKLQGNERETLAPKQFADGTFQRKTARAGIYSKEKGQANNTKGTSEWEGWGTALKPAHEPITVARKPLSEKTVAENCLKWGVGGINIDGCRINYNNETPNDLPKAGKRTATFGTQDTISGGDGSGGWEANQVGRFPANLIWSCNEDEYVIKSNISAGDILRIKEYYESKKSQVL